MSRTKEQWAELLNGRDYSAEVTPEEDAQLKEDGFVAVFGYSDDNAEFRGAISDETGAYDKTELYVKKSGLLQSHEERDCDCAFCGYETAKKSSKVIVADFSANGWVFTTDIPHAKFEVKEDGAHFGEGIVFSMSDLPGDNILTCVYCGRAYPEGTPPHGSQILTDHIRVCEKHPLRACEKERDSYKSLLAVCKKALAAQAGSEDLNQLDGMEGHIRITPAIPEMDRVTAINLIDALRQIISAGL